ncbi:MAG: efflux transporter periplasmic adaptor subunit [Rivularia sp. (in: Bacteria)]|nr:efflux transporter periplasmic adaptor subunit [Rivularia sp. MS3]
MHSRKNNTTQSASSKNVRLSVNSSSGSQRMTSLSLVKARLKKNWWFLPVIGVLLTISIISVKRLNQTESRIESQAKNNYLPVTVTKVALEPLKAWIASEGTVRAVKLKHLTFDFEGEVTYIAKRDSGRILRPGDRVKKGELLARVDDREAVADLNKAVAGVIEAQKQKSVAAADVAKAKAKVAQAESQVREKQALYAKALSSLKLSQTRMERYKKIYQEGVISADDFDTRSIAVDTAKAELVAAQAAITTAQKEVESAQSEVEAAQEKLEAADSAIVNARAQLTQSRVGLEGSRLYAPFNGVVAYINIRERETFSPQIVNSQLGGDYQGILDRVPIVIVDPSLLEVSVNLAKTDRKQVVIGQTAIISNKSYPENHSDDTSNSKNLIKGIKAKGRVFGVNPVVNPGRRSISATIRITEGGMKLQHGERVTAWIAVDGKPRALVLPLKALTFREQKPYIFVVNPEKAVVEQRSVKLGIKGIDKQEILSGVKAGEYIVVEGQNRLVDETPVKIVRKVDYPSPSLPFVLNNDDE